MIQFNKKIQERFDQICKIGQLYRVSLTGREIWALYLDSFSTEHNPVFRDPESSFKNCNHCNNFVKRYGNIVAIDENFEIVTMFDIITNKEYQNTADVLSKAIKESVIESIFLETFNSLNSLPYEKCTKTQETFRLGTHKNVKQYTEDEANKFGIVKAKEIRTFNHMFLNLPKVYVAMTNDSIEKISAVHKSNRDVFKRAMEEISLDTLMLVRDLIIQGSLLNGDTHIHKVEKMIPLKKVYDNLNEEQRENWCWTTSRDFQFAKFKNELIGVLCSELAEGEELNKACLSWNKRVDPANYMKAVAPITKKQIEEAQKYVVDNGYESAFTRRFAVIDDIKASEIRHINSGDGKIEEVSIFDSVKSTKSRHKRNEFKDVTEVSIDKFLKEILPGCTSVEAFLDNEHTNNMVTLTTAGTEESKPIFKWDNNYSWTFNGDLAGKSQIKEAVKSQGGKVDGVLRFSIMWAEGPVDNSDLDAHCQEPQGGALIYFSDRVSYATKGNLDIDITQPQNHKRRGRDVVENITYPQISTMIDGTYDFMVHQYANRGSVGFKAEIEFGGEIFSYEYPKNVRGKILVAQVTLKDGEFTIKHNLEETSISKEVYGLDTNYFHKVNLVCLSPNHWSKNKVGNKHYFFMLDKAKVNTSIRSFHVENLIPELLTHRKVIEVLGTTTRIEAKDKQLSGLGFNSTVRDSLVVKLAGNFKRMVRIHF